MLYFMAEHLEQNTGVIVVFGVNVGAELGIES